MKALHHLVTLNGHQLHIKLIQNYKNRPTIVFLHDSLGCVELWREFPSKLCADTQCNLLVYDRLGYGRSDPMPAVERTNRYMEDEADTLINLLAALRIEYPVLFGHSDGASIALIAAGKYPSSVKAVIAEAGHVFVEQITLEGIEAAVTQYNTTDLQQRLEKYHGNKTDTVFKAWTQTWLRKSFSSWNIEHFLTSIECPVLIIQGEQDEYGSIKQVEAIAERVKGEVEVCMIPETGHTPHKEKQLEVLERSLQFIIKHCR